MSKILVVDDQLSMRMLISRKLRSAFEVTIVEAEGVVSAISYLSSEKFDLVICDYWMEDGKGSKVSEHVLEKLMGNTPLIIFSSDVEIVNQYNRNGLHEAVLKPQLSNLIATVKQYINRLEPHE